MNGSATRRSRSGSAFGDVLDDVERGALAQVVDVGLEGQAEAGDGRVPEPLGLGHDLLRHVVRLVVVDLAGGADQPGQLRVRPRR